MFHNKCVADATEDMSVHLTQLCRSMWIPFSWDGLLACASQCLTDNAQGVKIAFVKLQSSTNFLFKIWEWSMTGVITDGKLCLINFVWTQNSEMFTWFNQRFEWQSLSQHGETREIALKENRCQTRISAGSCDVLH